MVRFLVGVDGGGSGTRVLLAAADGDVLARGEAGPSALSQGIGAAWREIGRAVAQAFGAAGLMTPHPSSIALGAGLAGANHKPWRDAFRSDNPGYGRLAVDTDAYTALLGAHGRRPGALIAVGTGSVGEALRADGQRCSVGGWGFPSGDEGSGAWLGLRAVAHAQAALDGRSTAGELAQRVWAHCGADRDALLGWCADAGQAAYARLAPAVFDAAGVDGVASQLLACAATALEALAVALDPAGDLPLAITGSVGRRLVGCLSPLTSHRCVESADGAEWGALALIRREMHNV